MKNTAPRLILASTVLLTAFFGVRALAASPSPLDVSASDLTAAGISGVTPVVPVTGRFAPPVRYFRSAEKLSAKDAAKDCADCADLIAVYAAETSTVPSWADTPQQQFLKLGGRLQLRTYIKPKRRVVTVTAPNEIMLRKISGYLVAKFSK